MLFCSSVPREGLGVRSDVLCALLGEKKREKRERNLTDVAGKATVSFGEGVLERDYACSTEIAETRNYIK